MFHLRTRSSCDDRVLLLLCSEESGLRGRMMRMITFRGPLFHSVRFIDKVEKGVLSFV